MVAVRVGDQDGVESAELLEPRQRDAPPDVPDAARSRGSVSRRAPASSISSVAWPTKTSASPRHGARDGPRRPHDNPGAGRRPSASVALSIAEATITRLNDVQPEEDREGDPEGAVGSCRRTLDLAGDEEHGAEVDHLGPERHEQRARYEVGPTGIAMRQEPRDAQPDGGERAERGDADQQPDRAQLGPSLGSRHDDDEERRKRCEQHEGGGHGAPEPADPALRREAVHGANCTGRRDRRPQQGADREDCHSDQRVPVDSFDESATDCSSAGPIPIASPALRGASLSTVAAWPRMTAIRSASGSRAPNSRNARAPASRPPPQPPVAVERSGRVLVAPGARGATDRACSRRRATLSWVGPSSGAPTGVACVCVPWTISGLMLVARPAGGNEVHRWAGVVLPPVWPPPPGRTLYDAKTPTGRVDLLHCLQLLPPPPSRRHAPHMAGRRADMAGLVAHGAGHDRGGHRRGRRAPAGARRQQVGIRRARRRLRRARGGALLGGWARQRHVGEALSSGGFGYLDVRLVGAFTASGAVLAVATGVLIVVQA